MPAFTVVTMDIFDDGWIAPYFAAVPAILTRHGGVSIAASRDIFRVEGDLPTPQRIAIFRFPSLTAIERFLVDEDYRPFREHRERGAKSQIFRVRKCRRRWRARLGAARRSPRRRED